MIAQRYYYCFIALVCLNAPTSIAADYYVSPTGNDKQQGTPTQPLKTIAKALEKTSDGDRIIVNGGEYTQALTFYQKPNLTIEGINRPIIRKQWIVSSGSTGMQIKGFKFDLSGVCQQAAITIRSGVHDVLIEDNQVYNAHLGGVSVEAQTNGVHTPNERLVLRNNYFERIPTAMSIVGKQHLVEGNTVVHGTQRTEGCQFVNNLDADGIKFYGQDHVIRHNRFLDLSFYTDDSFYNPNLADPLLKNSHTDCFQTSSMSWFAKAGQYRNDKTNNIRIEGNLCDAFSIKNLEAGDTAGVMYLEQAENIYFYNNITHALGIGGHGHVKNLHIFNNTLTMRSAAWRALDYPGWDADTQAQALIDLQSDFPASIYIYNNILYDAHHAPVLIYDANWRNSNRAKVHNNLAYWRHGLDGDNGNTSTWQWFDCDKGVLADEYGNHCADPQFIDSEAFNWQLQAGSPAIDAAVFPHDIAMAEQPQSDIQGLQRSNGIAQDIGAYEADMATASTCPTQQRGLIYANPSTVNTSCFRPDIEADGKALSNEQQLSADTTLKLAITLNPDSTDLGKTATLLLLAKVNDSWFIRDAAQNWQVFNGQLLGQSVTLNATLSQPIWQGKLFPASFSFFSAYIVGDKWVFNGQNPLSFVLVPTSTRN